MTSKNGDGGTNLFLAATRRNVGKTTASLGLFAALRECKDNIGYIKPVGQNAVMADGACVDKDVVLMREIFSLNDKVTDMSPVTIPPGFTETYISHPDPGPLERSIVGAFERVSRGKDFVFVEGTGHAGVGSVVDLSNARVASLLGLKTIVVGQGGIGNPIDEIMLNWALFERMHAPVIGAILNKVHEDKIDKIRTVAGRGLERLGVPLLGVIPYREVLTYPCMAQIADEIESEWVCGQQAMDNMVVKMVIGDLPSHHILDYFSGNTLLITPGNRDDVVLAAISSSRYEKEADIGVSGIVFTCGLEPHENILRLLKETGLPVLMAKQDTFTTATNIGRMIVKTRPSDGRKVQEIFTLFKQYVDIDRVLSLL